LLTGLGFFLSIPDERILSPQVSNLDQSSSASSVLPSAHAQSLESNPPTLTQTAAPEVFKRAFWRRPNAEDKILHAERREWLGADGLEKWQWFLVVEPSLELLKYLREDNAFSLKPVATVPVIEDAPSWFTYQENDVDTLQAANAQMLLIFSKSQRLLLASGSGKGFNPGAPEPLPSAPTVESTNGRLPPTSPPIPKRD